MRTDPRSLALLFAAALSTAAQGTMTVTYGSSTVHQHSDARYHWVNAWFCSTVVTLNPDPIFNRNEFFLRDSPSADFRRAMTESRAARDWKDKVTFDYTGSLNGNLTIDVYKATMVEQHVGGAQFLAHYVRGAGDPAAADLTWIQVVDTSVPNGGETIPYPDVYHSNYSAGARQPSYYRPDETRLDPNPYVGKARIRSGRYTVNGNTYDYDVAFWDFPRREAPEPASFNYWRGELFLSSYNATEKKWTIYDGVKWGFDIRTVPAPGTLGMLGTLMFAAARRRR